MRFIRAYQDSQGSLPGTIGIQRYEPATGLPVVGGHARGYILYPAGQWHVHGEAQMKLRPQTVRDVESVLNYLLGVLSSVKRGDRQELEEGAFDYARKVLAAAESPLRKLGMHEAAGHAINESERLILAGQLDEADQLLLRVGREMVEKSGTNDRLRKLYAPDSSKRKQ